MKKHDKYLYSILAVIFLASSAVSCRTILAGRQFDGLTLEVQLENEVVDSILLSELRERKIYEISADFGYNAFSAGSDGVRMVSSDCRGGDCLSMPPISMPESVIVCLPHKLILRLKGLRPDRNTMDGISY